MHETAVFPLPLLKVDMVFIAGKLCDPCLIA